MNDTSENIHKKSWNNLENTVVLLESFKNRKYSYLSW